MNSLHFPQTSLRVGLGLALLVVAQAQTMVDLRTQSKQVDFSGASKTRPFKTGTFLPAACAPGDAFFKTDAVAGQNLFGCTATNTWTPQSGGNGPTTIVGGVANYSASFTGQSAVFIPGSVHGMKSPALFVNCYDSSSPAHLVEPDSVTVDPTSFDITIQFAVGQTGQCVVNGWSSTAAGGASAAATGGASMAAQLGDFAVARTDGSNLTVASGCSAQTPCNARLNDTTYSIQSSATVTISAGTGTAFIYLSSAGALTVGAAMTVACSGCAVQASQTAFPSDSIPLFKWTATNGAWDVAGGSDQRAFLTAKPISGGAGILVSDTGSRTNISIDSAAVPTFLTATVSYDVPTIANGACSSDATIAVPGAVPGDAVVAGWPTGLGTGTFGQMWVSASDTVSMRICNLSGGAVDPPAASFRATIIRSF